MTSKNSGKTAVLGRVGEAGAEVVAEEVRSRSGASAGSAGTTLRHVEDPDHEIRTSRRCAVAAARRARCRDERRQVFDVPPVRIEVTEHQLISRACACGAVTRGRSTGRGECAGAVTDPRLAGIGVYLFHGQFLSKSRTVQALSDLFGVVVAAATLVGWTTRIAAQVTSTTPGRDPGPDHQGRGGALRRDRAASGRQLAWMHSASTPTDVLLRPRPPRDQGDGRRRSPADSPGSRCTTCPYTLKITHLCNAHASDCLLSIPHPPPPPTSHRRRQALESPHPPHPHLCAAPRWAGPTRAGDELEKYHALFTRLNTRWDDYQRWSQPSSPGTTMRRTDHPDAKCGPRSPAAYEPYRCEDSPRSAPTPPPPRQGQHAHSYPGPDPTLIPTPEHPPPPPSPPPHLRKGGRRRIPVVERNRLDVFDVDLCRWVLGDCQPSLGCLVCQQLQPSGLCQERKVPENPHRLRA